jgi:hypothetical protein
LVSRRKRSRRRRLGLSQMALARLMDVSAPAVAHWEAGESTPTGRNRVTLVALRKVRKRQVKECSRARLRRQPHGPLTLASAGREAFAQRGNSNDRPEANPEPRQWCAARRGRVDSLEATTFEHSVQNR